MGRLLPIALCALAVLAVVLLPSPAPSRLAVLESGKLFERPIRSDEADPPTLASAVLASDAVKESKNGELVLELYGVRMLTYDAAATGFDIAQTMGVRRAVAAALRQAAEKQGKELEILGERDMRVEHGKGANFLFELKQGSLEMMFNAGGQPDQQTSVQMDWRAPDKGSLVPPLVAVVLAVLFRRPLVALFLGILCGSVLVRAGGDVGLFSAAFQGLLDVFRRYFWLEFHNSDRAEIIGFVAFMLAMVGVMTRSGGIRGLMDAVARRARDVRRTQIAAYLMGLVIFFDDYANTILVGSTMRPLTDRFKISREKLSYIVDSTAAPVAGLSVFSTWIAFEVSTFSAQLPSAGLSVSEGYSVFFQSIPYSFYCILTLVFVAAITITGRDFGPMYAAERRARTLGHVIAEGSTPLVAETATSMEAAEGVTPRAWRAVLPLLTFLGVTFVMILHGGGAFEAPLSRTMTIEGFTEVLKDGSGSEPLLWGSMAGFLVAALAAAGAGIARDVVSASWKTLRSMWVAFAILYLAWMIGRVCQDDLGTAPYLTALASGQIEPHLLPSLLFVLAGVVAFATGSSWATMSILMPLVIGLAYGLGVDAHLLPDPTLSGQRMVVICVAAVLSGAIFGDHCSPISDTTVMSSIASASDHIDHVRTQAPYALIVMGASVAFGYVPVTFAGLSPWLSLLGGGALLVLLVRFKGRLPEAPAPAVTPSPVPREPGA